MEPVTDLQLLKEIKQLAKMVKGSLNVPENDMLTAIHDTFIKVREKMKEGLVPDVHYEDYKNYLFLSIKNNILAYFIRCKALKNSMVDDISLVPNVDRNYFTAVGVLHQQLSMFCCLWQVITPCHGAASRASFFNTGKGKKKGKSVEEHYFFRKLTKCPHCSCR